MPMECMNSIKLRQVKNFEELKQILGVKDNKIANEVKMFAWDSSARSLIGINWIDLELLEVGNTELVEYYNAEEITIFVEDFEV